MLRNSSLIQDTYIVLVSICSHELRLLLGRLALEGGKSLLLFWQKKISFLIIELKLYSMPIFTYMVIVVLKDSIGTDQDMVGDVYSPIITLI